MKNILPPPSSDVADGHYYDGCNIAEDLVTELISAIEIGGVYRLTFSCPDINIDQQKNGEWRNSTCRTSAAKMLIPGPMLAEIARRLQEVADYHAKQSKPLPKPKRAEAPKVPAAPAPLPANVHQLRPTHNH